MADAIFTAEEIVHDLYLALLNRVPEEEGLRSHARALRERGLPFVIRTIAESAEALAARGGRGKVKLALLGNCNMPALAACLGTCADIAPWWIADVTQRHSVPYAAALEAVERGSPDFVLSQQIWNYEEIATSRLRPLAGSKYRSFTTVYFRGLHPDLEYRDVATTTVSTPIHGHHSTVVVACFLSGMSARDCLARFNGKTFERLGLFDTYATSARELLEREQHVDIRFAAEFLEMTKHAFTLWTVSHPTSIVVAALARRITGALGLGARVVDPAAFPNDLDHSLIWPIHPVVREYHNVRYDAPVTFTEARMLGGRTITLEDFVRGSYDSYAEAGREAVCALFPHAEAVDL